MAVEEMELETVYVMPVRCGRHGAVGHAATIQLRIIAYFVCGIATFSTLALQYDVLVSACGPIHPSTATFASSTGLLLQGASVPL